MHSREFKDIKYIMSLIILAEIEYLFGISIFVSQMGMECKLFGLFCNKIFVMMIVKIALDIEFLRRVMRYAVE